MSDRLRYDLDQLRLAADQLDVLGREFQRAGEVVEDARAAVGHPHLADRLGHFVDGWKVHRQDLLEDMTHLAEMTHSAVTTYTQVDDQLTGALDGSDR